MPPDNDTDFTDAKMQQLGERIDQLAQERQYTEARLHGYFAFIAAHTGLSLDELHEGADRMFRTLHPEYAQVMDEADAEESQGDAVAALEAPVDEAPAELAYLELRGAEPTELMLTQPSWTWADDYEAFTDAGGGVSTRNKRFDVRAVPRCSECGADDRTDRANTHRPSCSKYVKPEGATTRRTLHGQIVEVKANEPTPLPPSDAPEDRAADTLADFPPSEAEPS